MRSVYVGIDPGISGAVALLDGVQTEVWDTPSMTVKVGQKVRSEYHIEHMAATMANIKSYCSDERVCPVIWLELVGVLPTDGRLGAFSFGKGYGAWQGILCALDMPFTLVRPQAWKKFHGLTGCDKAASLETARTLFPDKLSQLARVKDHNRADALLIAQYGRAQQ